MDSDFLFRALFWVLIALMLFMRVFFTLKVRLAGSRIMPDREAVKREGTAAFLVRFFGFFALIGFLIAYAFYPPWISSLSIPFPAWLRWIGFILAAAGFGLALWAQIALGRQWSAQVQLQEKHRIISSGPYVRMRHPIYSALALWGIGLALLTAHWVFVVIGVLACGIFVIRVPREEQMMIEQFGDEYREYMKRTGRVFPKF